jgi:hypothetical protein
MVKTFDGGSFEAQKSREATKAFSSDEGNHRWMSTLKSCLTFGKSLRVQRNHVGLTGLLQFQQHPNNRGQEEKEDETFNEDSLLSGENILDWLAFFSSNNIQTAGETFNGDSLLPSLVFFFVD